jgi:DNA polymerase lambda
LVTRGFTTIDQFRKAVFEDETEKLDRNQLVGLVCYEDINEDMDRTEAEMIFQVVSRAVKDRIPQAELSLMGSYRRGKTELGDVDILITSLYPHYRNYVSGKLLGQVVDSLCDSGHIAYHLTFLGGMDPCRFETLPASYAKYTYNPHDFGTQHAKNDGPRKSQTYMGVFYSPVRRGKRCRVDIKFYPHRERVYATLYFTGSAYFNRSMRLWTLKKKGWNLNDHGLFDGEKSKIRVMDGEKEFEANCEKDVFESSWRGNHISEPVSMQ